MKTKSRASTPSVGWREWAALPGLGIKRVKAKVDTGARSSCLHAVDIRISAGRRPRVHFKVHPLQNDTKTTVRCEAPLLDERLVKSSNGKNELRPAIEAWLELGGERWAIELTLTSRDMMGFRMLLGRQAIRRRFVVDPGRSFLTSKRARRHR